MMTQVTIPKEQLQKLMDLFPDMSTLQQDLKAVVNNDIMKRLNKIKETMNEVFTPFFEEEENEIKKDSDALGKLIDENNFKTMWSVSEVPATMMNDKTGFKVKKITYQSWGDPQEVVFAKARQLTWLEMWKEADKLVRLSGDTHHIFVEMFSEYDKSPGTFSLVCGS